MQDLAIAIVASILYQEAKVDRLSILRRYMEHAVIPRTPDLVVAHQPRIQCKAINHDH